jgi:hypothetical protein
VSSRGVARRLVAKYGRRSAAFRVHARRYGSSLRYHLSHDPAEDVLSRYRFWLDVSDAIVEHESGKRHEVAV